MNDLLQLARADAGRALAKEPVEVASALEETVRQANQLDPGRNIHLVADLGLTILGDKDALKQILLIALDNALKHSGGYITVSAERKGSSVEIRVQDFGEGIPPETVEHLFDRFYRGDEAASIPGFGLGLPIARALVQAQGGEIKLEARWDREPWSFSVYLSLDPSPAVFRIIRDFVITN